MFPGGGTNKVLLLESSRPLTSITETQKRNLKKHHNIHSGYNPAQVPENKFHWSLLLTRGPNPIQLSGQIISKVIVSSQRPLFNAKLIPQLSYGILGWIENINHNLGCSQAKFLRTIMGLPVCVLAMENAEGDRRMLSVKDRPKESQVNSRTCTCLRATAN